MFKGISLRCQRCNLKKVKYISDKELKCNACDTRYIVIKEKSYVFALVNFVLFLLILFSFKILFKEEKYLFALITYLLIATPVNNIIFKYTIKLKEVDYKNKEKDASSSNE